MRRTGAKFVSWLLIVSLVPFLSGCEGFRDYTLTGHLWDSDQATDAHSPSPHPNFRMFEDPSRKDFLVEYDEAGTKEGVLKRRAYYLNENEKRINGGKKPHFVNPDKSHGLASVAVSTNGVASTNITSTSQIQVIFQPDQRHFAVMSDGHELGEYFLPVYSGWGSDAGRVVLTPLTVTGDIVIFGTIAAAVLGLIYLSGMAHSDSH